MISHHPDSETGFCLPLLQDEKATTALVFQPLEFLLPTHLSIHPPESLANLAPTVSDEDFCFLLVSPGNAECHRLVYPHHAGTGLT